MRKLAEIQTVSRRASKTTVLLLVLAGLLPPLMVAAQSPGVLGRSPTTAAVRGEAGDITGIAQPLGAVGVVGIGSNRGTYGSSSAGVGLYGVSASNYGVWGQSTDFRGVTGRTSRADNNYGFYTPDNLFALNASLQGSIHQVMRNSGGEPLLPGDVVVFEGVAEPLRPGDPPVLLVSRAKTAGSSAVAGVVLSRFNIDAVDPDLDDPDQNSRGHAIEVTPEGPVATDEFLLVVVRGPAQVNVAGSIEGIRPGDLLGSSATPGLAHRSALLRIAGMEIAPPGTVLGKALEPAAPHEHKRLYVYVTL